MSDTQGIPSNEASSLKIFPSKTDLQPAPITSRNTIFNFGFPTIDEKEDKDKKNPINTDVKIYSKPSLYIEQNTTKNDDPRLKNWIDLKPLENATPQATGNRITQGQQSVPFRTNFNKVYDVMKLTKEVNKKIDNQNEQVPNTHAKIIYY